MALILEGMDKTSSNTVKQTLLPFITSFIKFGTKMS